MFSPPSILPLYSTWTKVLKGTEINSCDVILSRTLSYCTHQLRAARQALDVPSGWTKTGVTQSVNEPTVSPGVPHPRRHLRGLPADEGGRGRHHGDSERGCEWRRDGRGHGGGHRRGHGQGESVCAWWCLMKSLLRWANTIKLTHLPLIWCEWNELCRRT